MKELYERLACDTRIQRQEFKNTFETQYFTDFLCSTRRSVYGIVCKL
jgi:hypothetical protein